jgi:hypothetical protein
LAPASSAGSRWLEILFFFRGGCCSLSNAGNESGESFETKRGVADADGDSSRLLLLH